MSIHMLGMSDRLPTAPLGKWDRCPSPQDGTVGPCAATRSLSAKGQHFMLGCDGALPRSSQNLPHFGEGSREPVWHAPSWSPEPSAWLGRSGDHQPVMRCADACARSTWSRTDG